MDSTDRYRVFVGTRTHGDEGIFSFDLDLTEGTLTAGSRTPNIPNPSFLSIHPSDDVMYAVNQEAAGQLTALSIDWESGELHVLNRRSTDDARPCYVSIDGTGRVAMVAHHTGGTITMFPAKSDGSLGSMVDQIERSGSSVHPERQTRSRPHAILPGPDNRFCYVPDLGADTVWIYELDVPNRRFLSGPPEITIQPGAGPRHFAFHPNGRIAYLINQLDSTLTTMAVEEESGALRQLDTISTLPEEYVGENHAADIHVHPTGKWVFGTNRGHNSLAVFRLDNDTMTPQPHQHQSTLGDWPRNFAIGPHGNYIFVANQRSDSIVVFAFDAETGSVSQIDHSVSVPRPTCIEIVPIP